MIKVRTTILFFFIIIGCYSVLSAQSYKDNSKKFKENCQSLIEPNESLVRSWYHYVVSQDENEQFILRVFYPQTNQIVKLETFNKKKLKSKEGPAKYWRENGDISSEGNYEKNKRVGKWKQFIYGHLSAEGSYINGKMNGPWTSYDSSGVVTEVIKYKMGIKSGKFIQYDSLGNVFNQGEYRSDTIFTQTNSEIAPKLSVVEVMPFMKKCEHIEDLDERKICSDQALIQFIQNNLKYPYEAREYGIEGRAFAQFSVNEDGSVVDFVPIRVHCDQIKDELERLVNSLPDFSPGTQNGVPVKVLYTLPFTFQLK